MREGSFPPLVGPVVDKGEFTVVTTGLNKCVVPNCVRPSNVARGLVWGPLTLDWDRVSITQPILNRLGCVFPNVPVIYGRPLPYALTLQQTSETQNLSSTLFSLLINNFPRLNFFSTHSALSNFC